MDLKTYLKETKKELEQIDFNLFILRLSISLLYVAIPLIFFNLFLSKELDNFWLRIGVSSSIILFLGVFLKGIKGIFPPKVSALMSFSFINEIDNYNDLIKICIFLWIVVISLILYNQDFKYKYGTSKTTIK